MLLISIQPLSHFNERPIGTAIDTFVIHSMYAKDANEKLSLSECRLVLDACQVSAHYLIATNGEIWSCVPEEKRAWHAGVSTMPFESDKRAGVNDFSIGVELIATETSGFTTEQYEALSALTLDILGRWSIKYIVGHEHIAPGRKVDPGPNFDWPKYRNLLTQAATGKGFDIISISFAA